MELGLSLQLQSYNSQKITGTDLGFCMAVGKVCSDDAGELDQATTTTSSSADPPLQLHLLPFPPPSNTFPFTWLTQNSLLSEEGRKRNLDEITADRRRVFCRDRSDEEDVGSATATKKLRLTKHQSAFLEDSFKQHSTLNPKEKVALAKRLNLRPRQVEVWFQNRRARTKLKQTEVDCEYLSKYCETLKEENRRLQKELQELRALNASNPFYMQLPATTLTMCPSCQKVATPVADGAGAGAGVTIVANHS